MKNKIDLTEIEFRKIWKNENTIIEITSHDKINLKITGGYSSKRVSIFEVHFSNGKSIIMNLLDNSLNISTIDGFNKLEIFTNDSPLRNMVDYFSSLRIDAPKNL
jgi:hypothetical protein